MEVIIQVGGLLKITIKEAKLLFDDRLLSYLSIPIISLCNYRSMNPFIAFEYEGAHFKTHVIKDGGRNPHFNEVLYTLY